MRQFAAANRPANKRSKLEHLSECQPLSEPQSQHDHSMEARANTRLYLGLQSSPNRNEVVQSILLILFITLTSITSESALATTITQVLKG